MMYRTHREPEPAPTPAPGFENIRRQWDATHLRWAATLLPGELFVTRHDELITTVVGSAIAVCIRDPALRVGGMCHFMLPVQSDNHLGAPTSDPDGSAASYGRDALGRLIGELLKLGADGDRLKAKMYGGGRNISLGSDVGAKTVTFVRRFLRAEGLPVVAEKLGESHARHIVYSPSSGQAVIRRVPSRYTAGIAKREIQYFKSLFREPSAADIELFTAKIEQRGFA